MMHTPPHPTHPIRTKPADLTPEERTQEVAAILAQAVVQLRRRGAVFAPDIPESKKPGMNIKVCGRHALTEGDMTGSM